MGQPIKTRKIPNTKKPVARAFFGCKKKPAVRPGPMVMGTPAMINRLPIRNNVLWKNKVIPDIVKNVPNANNAIPSLWSPYLIRDGTPLSGSYIVRTWTHTEFVDAVRRLSCKRPRKRNWWNIYKHVPMEFVSPLCHHNHDHHNVYPLRSSFCLDDSNHRFACLLDRRIPVKSIDCSWCVLCCHHHNSRSRWDLYHCCRLELVTRTMRLTYERTINNIFFRPR